MNVPIKRIAVFVSGGGTNLQSLLIASGQNQLNGATVTLVIASNANCYALTRAEAAGVSASIYDKKRRESAEYVTDLLAELQGAEIDLIVLAGYLAILPSAVLSQYCGRVINIHPSLLPKYGGKGMYGICPHQAALEAGETIAGATVHLVTDEIDKGTILMQRSLPIWPNDTAESLQQRVMNEIESTLLAEVIRQWNQGVWAFPLLKC